jgi:glyoxylase-like metal-dependent hydrolase (beta-lactamase superfamily II)
VGPAIYLRQLMLGPMDNFVYLVGPPVGDVCAVVDPAWDVPAILDAAAQDGRKVTHALVTHCHFDHTNGLQPLLERQPVQVVAQKAEVAFSRELASLGDALHPVEAGEVVDLGGLQLKCLHTPGHTPGSQCFHAEDALVTGDTLFIGACGRCDLAGGDPEAMFGSLKRLRALDPGTVVYPGHDYGDTPSSSLRDEIRVNPYLKLAERDAFVNYRMRPRR